MILNPDWQAFLIRPVTSYPIGIVNFYHGIFGSMGSIELNLETLEFLYLTPISVTEEQIQEIIGEEDVNHSISRTR